MLIATCLRCAEAAKKDPSLIPNHTNGNWGVDYHIRKHIEETEYLISICDPDPEGFLPDLKNELLMLTDALAVYTAKMEKKMLTKTRIENQIMANNIGKEIAGLLGLMLKHNGRVDTDIGDKTYAGLARTIERIFEEHINNDRYFTEEH